MTSDTEQQLIDEAQSGFDNTEDARNVDPTEAGEGQKAGEDTDTRKGLPNNEFREMVTRGSNYRREYDAERYGDTVTIELGPLKDPIFKQLLELMEEEMGKEDFNNMVTRQDGQKPDEVDADALDEVNFDLGQIDALILAAKLGIDPQSVGPNETRETIADLVDEMVGMLSMEIGAAVMELTADVGQVDEFPGGRNR